MNQSLEGKEPSRNIMFDNDKELEIEDLSHQEKLAQEILLKNEKNLVIEKDLVDIEYLDENAPKKEREGKEEKSTKQIDGVLDLLEIADPTALAMKVGSDHLEKKMLDGGKEKNNEGPNVPVAEDDTNHPYYIDDNPYGPKR